MRCYGSSEQPTITAGRFDDPLERRAHDDGTPLPHCEVRVVRADGADAPVGVDGEVWLRGPDQFVGYTDPALNAESFTPDGWFRSGDVGRLDAEGRLAITDRLKDVVIRGGETISSMEVEALLARHPAIAEAAVVGVPDERYGERVGAFLLLRPGAAPPTTRRSAGARRRPGRRPPEDARVDLRGRRPPPHAGRQGQEARAAAAACPAPPERTGEPTQTPRSPAAQRPGATPPAAPGPRSPARR